MYKFVFVLCKINNAEAKCQKRNVTFAKESITLAIV